MFIRICWLERIPGRNLWFSAVVETGVLVWGAGGKQEKELVEEGSEWGPHKFKSKQLAGWVTGGNIGWEHIWLWMLFQKDTLVLCLTVLRIRAGYSHQIHPPVTSLQSEDVCDQDTADSLPASLFCVSSYLLLQTLGSSVPSFPADFPPGPWFSTICYSDLADLDLQAYSDIRGFHSPTEPPYCLVRM